MFLLKGTTLLYSFTFTHLLSMQPFLIHLKGQKTLIFSGYRERVQMGTNGLNIVSGTAN